MRFKAIATIALLLFSGVTLAYSKQVLEIQSKKVLRLDKSSAQGPGLSFRSDVSQRNLLGLQRESPCSLPLLSKRAASVTKTLRILGIRVEFEEEVPDDPRTTGNGLFDMRTQGQFYEQEGHLIDPAPHDTLYFEKHIQALSNYWHDVSEGRLSLEGEIFPKAETLAYRLPHPMAYYGAPDSSLSVKVEMLRRFFHDSFGLADSLSVHGDPQIYHIDFSKYDCFVIFHAGADLQGDLGTLVNPTPADLFTGFITLGDTVWVNDGTFPITEGTFMPETRSQDNRVTALNGVFAHEFGHQLGLVDLYNSQNFMTQVGDFSLMDNNAQNVGVDVGYGVFVSGVLPVYPDAWSRAYLGFVEPQEIRSENGIKLFAAEKLTNQLQLIKIPVSPEEYFLLENREVDLDGDHFSGLRVDSTTNVILGPVDMNKDFNREYDWLLPGSGILIWHVDEGVAYLDYDGNGVNNFWDNDLQADKDRRFLTIVEADGIVDFGGNYYNGFGDKQDIFYDGNKTEFTPHSFPSSKSNNKSDTHISVTNIGFCDTVMSLDIAQDWVQSGFPRKFIPEAGASPPVSGDLCNNGNTETLVSSGRFIHAWGPGGTGLFPYPDSVQAMRFDSTVVTFPLAIFAEDTLSTFFGPPSLGDLNGDDTLEIVAATVDGRVFAWHPYDRNGDGRADLVNGFPVHLGERISMGPVVANFDENHVDREILVGGEQGLVKLVGQDGAVKYEKRHTGKVIGLAMDDTSGIFFLLTEDTDKGYLTEENIIDSVATAEIPATGNSLPVLGDINRDGYLEVMLVSGDGKVHAWDSDLKPLPGFPVETNLSMVRANPVLGDLDKDGHLDIIVAYQDRIFAYNFGGSPLSNFPITISHPGGPTDLIESPPILGDVDGDGYPDIVVGTKNKQILAYNKDGKMVDGFPLPVNGAVTSSPILLNLDKDVNAELLTVSDDGFIYAWDLPGEYKKQNFPWTMYGHDAGHTNYFPEDSLPPVRPVTGDLLPASMAFNYPNPANSQTKIRYFLKQDAEVDIKIFDLSGMLVEEFPGPGTGRIHNERPWDCSRFASGVYLCRVEAKSETDNQVVFFKIALVK
ncbi:MAG: FG-GAP-like repeat-containing protein [Candidatus Zixiibacteriota bacterium]